MFSGEMQRHLLPFYPWSLYRYLFYLSTYPYLFRARPTKIFRRSIPKRRRKNTLRSFEDREKTLIEKAVLSPSKERTAHHRHASFKIISSSLFTLVFTSSRLSLPSRIIFSVCAGSPQPIFTSLPAAIVAHGCTNPSSPYLQSPIRRAGYLSAARGFGSPTGR